MKKMLILTGPQGSGNHLFSKLFSEHPDVYGWEALKTKYWEGHDQEPFAECWQSPIKLFDFDWSQKEYYVTSISYPYRYHGVNAWPDYKGFLQILRHLEIVPKICIIGRDQNILKFQEERLRGRQTYDDFLLEVPNLVKQGGVFLSQELLYLYGANYIQSIGQQLGFPVSQDKDAINEILNQTTPFTAQQRADGGVGMTGASVLDMVQRNSEEDWGTIDMRNQSVEQPIETNPEVDAITKALNRDYTELVKRFK